MEPINRQESIELMERADLLMVDGDSEEARGLLQRAVDIDPNNREARRMLEGITERMSRKPAADATRDLGHSRHSVEDIDQLIADARHAMSMGQYDLALSLCHRALAIDPDNAAAKAEMMATRTILGQFRS